MSEEKKLSPAGVEIVDALSGFLEVIQEGAALADRFTVRTVELDLPCRTFSGEDVKRTRALLGLNQALFARFLGVGIQTVRSREQGTREPSGMANRFLDEVAANPPSWQARLRDLMASSVAPKANPEPPSR